MNKRKKIEPINDPDLTNTDPVYWEKVLESHGLGMIQGRSPRAVYVGGSEQITRAEEKEFRTSTGKVTPPGHPPDRDGSDGRN